MGKFGNRMTAFAAIAALVATLGHASTAQADTSDLAKAIAGIAAVAVIAHAIDQNRKKQAEVVTSTNSPILLGDGRNWRDPDGTYGYYDRQGRRVVEGRILPYGDDARRHGPKAERGYKRWPLPTACLRTVESGRGRQPAYLSSCLDRNYRFASKLPNSCETAVRTGRQLNAVYGAHCLARDGWKVAER